MPPWPRLTDAEILAARGPRETLDSSRPWAFLVEPELSPAGTVDEVATVFLTNKECPMRCLMCDLWQQTTTETVPEGAIPTQIEFALSQLPVARHIKLYNSANFFDPGSIPVADYPAIARQVRNFETCIVENHPNLCGERTLKFRDLLRNNGVDLEVALGLESVHPDVLPRLNKQMTLDDFDHAVEFLLTAGIRVRSFVLLRPPFLSEEDGIEWAGRSVQHAFRRGVSACSVVPTRAGNGIMEQLERDHWFTPPSLAAMEETLERCLAIAAPGRQRVFVDLWGAEQFATCADCADDRIQRLQRMNWSQKAEDRLESVCCSGN